MEERYGAKIPIQAYSPAEKRTGPAVGRSLLADGHVQSREWPLAIRLDTETFDAGQDSATAGSPPDGFVSYRGAKRQCTRGV